MKGLVEKRALVAEFEGENVLLVVGQRRDAARFAGPCVRDTETVAAGSIAGRAGQVDEGVVVGCPVEVQPPAHVAPGIAVLGASRPTQRNPRETQRRLALGVGVGAGRNNGVGGIPGRQRGTHEYVRHAQVRLADDEGGRR